MQPILDVHRKFSTFVMFPSPTIDLLADDAHGHRLCHPLGQVVQRQLHLVRHIRSKST